MIYKVYYNEIPEESTGSIEFFRKADFILEENIHSIISTFHAIDHNKGMDDDIVYWKMIMKENCGLKDIQGVTKIEQVPIAKNKD